MARKTRTRARERQPLNRERVLQAGLQLADEAGLESLSMRRLGQMLGVEAIRTAMAAGVRRYGEGDGFELPIAANVASARVPA